MRISLARLLLPLLLAFAFVVRFEPTRTLRLAEDEQRDLGGAKWLIDDPLTCHELRRIELAIVQDRVPTHDRFVNFPAVGEIPALNFFAGAVAGVAQRVLRSPSGPAALGYVEERELEDFVVKLGPILGLLAVLATYWAARSIVTGPRGDVAVLCAAGFVAFHPALVASSAAGTLDSAALATIACALLVRSTVRSIRATEMPISLLDALVAGALAGILVVSSVVGFVVFLAAWTAFFLHAHRSSGEARSNALRSGVFFTVVAAFLARMSFTEGQLDESQIVGGFSAGISLLVFFTSIPYLLLFLFDRHKKPNTFRVACFVVALGLMLTQVPIAWKTLWPGVRWFIAHHADLARVAPEWTAKFLDVGVLASALVSIAIVAWSWKKRGETCTVALVAFVVASGLAACVSSLALPLWATAVALALARVLDDDSAPRRAVLATSGLIAVLAATTLRPSLAGVDAQLRQERLDFVIGLRWLRENSASGGPWNSPTTPSSWGVLSNTADGPLVLYHARRPALASPYGILSDPRTLAGSSGRLHGDDLALLERWMRGQEAQYVVVGGRASRRERDRAPIAATAEAESVSDRLLAAASGPARAVGEFALEYVSQRRVDAAGRTVLDDRAGRPVIAIWRLARAETNTPRAELSPR